MRFLRLPLTHAIFFLSLFLFLLAAGDPLPAVEPSPSDFEVLYRSEIFHHPSSDPKDPANTSGFNHGPNVIRVPDGRLMAVWFSASREGAPEQRIMRAYSSDLGKTWTAAETLQDEPGRADFDPSLLVSGSRTFLFYAVDEPMNAHFRVSEDSGSTWSASTDLKQKNHTTRANGIRLATGELLAPLHLRGTKGAGVMKSTDDGKTWQRHGLVMNPEGQGGEPTIAQLPSGKVMMILRTKDGEVWRSLSSDKGETWGATEKTGLTGTASAHHLLTLRDGTLVLTLNPVKPPLRFPLAMRLSPDEGATWREPVVIATRPENVGGWQTSYPSVIELEDGTLLAVWTLIKNTSSVLHGDIHAARIKVRRDGASSAKPKG